MRSSSMARAASASGGSPGRSHAAFSANLPSSRSARTGGCGRCSACLWFEQGNHPGFPESRQRGGGALPKASRPPTMRPDADAADATEAGPRSKRAPSREIRVDQVRALQGFLAIATHRDRNRVVLMYPLETLNDVAGQRAAEDARGAAGEDRVRAGRGPSRPGCRPRSCRAVARSFVPTPDKTVAVDWLAGAGRRRPWRGARRGGRGGRSPRSRSTKTTSRLAGTCCPSCSGRASRPRSRPPTPSARTPAAPLIRWLQQWLADCIAMRLAGRIRYHPTQSKAIATLCHTASVDALLQLAQRLDAVRRTIDHPLNTRLLLESLLTAYADAVIPGSA